jgi:hypothetical protein
MVAAKKLNPIYMSFLLFFLMTRSLCSFVRGEKCEKTMFDDVFIYFKTKVEYFNTLIWSQLLEKYGFLRIRIRICNLHLLLSFSIVDCDYYFLTLLKSVSSSLLLFCRPLFVPYPDAFLRVQVLTSKCRGAMWDPPPPSSTWFAQCSSLSQPTRYRKKPDN